jgi:hypothetical protein
VEIVNRWEAGKLFRLLVVANQPLPLFQSNMKAEPRRLLTPIQDQVEEKRLFPHHQVHRGGQTIDQVYPTVRLHQETTMARPIIISVSAAKCEMQMYLLLQQEIHEVAEIGFHPHQILVEISVHRVEEVTLRQRLPEVHLARHHLVRVQGFLRRRHLLVVAGVTLEEVGATVVVAEDLAPLQDQGSEQEFLKPSFKKS